MQIKTNPQTLKIFELAKTFTLKFMHLEMYNNQLNEKNARKNIFISIIKLF